MDLPKFHPIIPVATYMVPDLKDPLWTVELKFDGFRGVLYIQQSSAFFISRLDNRMVEFEKLANSISSKLKVDTAVLDGEIVTIDLATMRCDRHKLKSHGTKLHYVAFDILWLNGRNLTNLPLDQRRKILRKLVAKCPHIIFSESQSGEEGWNLLLRAHNLGLEGVVFKKSSDVYTTSTRWYKIVNRNYGKKPQKPKRT